MKKAKQNEVTTRQLAAHRGCTLRWITAFVGKGMPKLGRDKFDLAIACQWMRRYDRSAWEKEQARAADVKNFWVGKTAHEAILTSRDQDRLQLSHGELLQASKVLPAIERIIIAFKDKKLSRGTRIATQCVGKSQAEIASLIEDFDRSTLAELSKAFQQLAGNYSATPGKPDPGNRRQA